MTNIKVVIGANFGDEGKGLMTDYFCNEAFLRNENCLVVCSNGGSQRGHTVTTPDGLRHVFRHFGSGTLVRAHTYLPKDFILNPIIFKQEYEEFLFTYGFRPIIFINPKCMITTPFDMIINQIVEESRGKGRHGSCGMGIWETIVRDGLRVEEFFNLHTNKKFEYLYDIRDNYLNNRLKELGVNQISKEWSDIIYSDGLISNYISDFEFMMNTIYACFSNNSILKQYKNIVFENGQGLLLDQNIEGYGEHTTPSNTGIKNPIKIINSVFNKNEYNLEICYVTRSYMTRHGAGRFDTECKKEDINPNMVDLTNIPNPHQGSLRYGKIDLNELVNRIKNDSKSIKAYISLAVTHMNEHQIDISSITSKFNRIYISDGLNRNNILV